MPLELVWALQVSQKGELRILGELLSDKDNYQMFNKEKLYKKLSINELNTADRYERRKSA